MINRRRVAATPAQSAGGASLQRGLSQMEVRGSGTVSISWRSVAQRGLSQMEERGNGTVSISWMYVAAARTQSAGSAWQQHWLNEAYAVVIALEHLVGKRAELLLRQLDCSNRGWEEAAPLRIAN